MAAYPTLAVGRTAFPTRVRRRWGAGPGTVPEWPFERPRPPGSRCVPRLARASKTRAVCLQAHPAVKPRVYPLAPEPDPRARTRNAWHVAGDGSLCLTPACLRLGRLGARGRPGYRRWPAGSSSTSLLAAWTREAHDRGGELSPTSLLDHMFTAACAHDRGRGGGGLMRPAVRGRSCSRRRSPTRLSGGERSRAHSSCEYSRSRTSRSSSGFRPRRRHGNRPISCARSSAGTLHLHDGDRAGMQVPRCRSRPARSRDRVGHARRGRHLLDYLQVTTRGQDEQTLGGSLRHLRPRCRGTAAEMARVGFSPKAPPGSFQSRSSRRTVTHSDDLGQAGPRGGP